jgi:hypothetical protein
MKGVIRIGSRLIATRLDRVLCRGVKLDQAIDGRSTTAAGAACSACLAHLVPAPSAGIDTTTNRVIIDRMTVAHQHD